MSNRLNRRPVSEGFRVFLGFTGGVLAVLGFFCFLVVVVSGPQEIFYGSIAAMVLGYLLLRYAISLEDTEKEKMGYSSTINETNKTVRSASNI